MMDEQRAKLMLKEIFTNRFDNDNFILFIKEIFNRFDYDRRDAKQEDISKDFQEFIDSFSSFGRYEDSEKKFVEILSVKLKKSNPESARTMQRNFIAKYLTQHNVDAALVAFYGDDVDNWRLSFVKLEYHLEKDNKGNVKPATTLTPPKRYSFLVGKTEPSHTAQSRFLELLMFQDQSPTISEIETSFSVEKVTKEFFEKYKELFLELEESMNHIVKQNKNLAKEFEEKGISTVDFAKKLLGQIVFIYFLQKKGWLGIEKDETGKFKEWGTGHKDFLRRLYNKDIVDYSNFFNDILEPLFYEALAKDRTTENDYYSWFNCKIPFLNGGLFEPLGGYDWTNVDILLDNKIFGKIIDTFDLYNFTVKEDEPLEKEVAIDPEMLGKVFENLLEVKDRKSKGSYYTPREIVYYMCQESLINYLETRTGIEKKNVDNFIYNGQISDQIRDNKDKIDKLLKDIKVVDPAIGSGAFPVGMMTEIIKSRATLTKLFPKVEQLERTLYNFKRECIEDSLYGVDIDPGAVDIAQLRLWLSLIVDETDIHKIKPLPNLDYKIMCGNSLLDKFEGVKLFDESLLGEIKKEDYSEEIKKIEENIRKLYKELGMITTGKEKDYGNGNEIKREINKLKKKQQKLMATPKKEGTYGSLFEVQKIKESQKKLKQLQALHKQFFNENNRKEKIELRKEIERLDWEFIEETLKERGNEEAKKNIEQIKKTRSKPFFLWKLYFADVFQENGGFDIIIGNPPYDVIYSSNSLEEYTYYKKIYYSAEYNPNLFALFIERGISLLRDGGLLGFIVPNSMINNKYFYNLRKLILDKTIILQIYDLKKDVFKSANVDTCIIILKKEPNEQLRLKNKLAFYFGDSASDQLEVIKEKKIIQETFLKYSFCSFNVIADDEFDNIRKKIEKDSINLGEIAEVYRGMVTRNNEECIFDTQKNSKYKPLLSGRDIGRYWLKFNNKYIYFDRSSIGGGCWDEKVYLNEQKLLVQLIRNLKLPRRLVVAYDDKKYYSLQNLNNIIVDESLGYSTKYILGIINSNLINYWFKKLFVDINIKRIYLKQIPIKKDKSRQNQLIKLVDKIISLNNQLMKTEDKTNRTIDLEDEIKRTDKEINEEVYEIYGIKEEERKFIEDSLKGA